MTDLVEQCVSDLFGELRARLDRTREVLAIEHDRWRLVARRRCPAHRSAIEPEDRRRKRRLHGLQIDGIRQIRNLDLDRLHVRPPLRRQRRDHRVDLLLELDDGDQHGRAELVRRELDRLAQLRVGGRVLPELLEREAEHLVRVRILRLDHERLAERGLRVGEPRQIEERHAPLVQRVAAAGRDAQRAIDALERLVAAAQIIERLRLEHGEVRGQRRIATPPRERPPAAALRELETEAKCVARAVALAVDVEVGDGAERLRIVGVERQRERVRHLRLAIAIERRERCTAEVMRLDRRRQDVARAIRAGPRRAVLAALDLLVGLVEQRLDAQVVVGAIRHLDHALDDRVLVMRTQRLLAVLRVRRCLRRRRRGAALGRACGLDRFVRCSLAANR